MTEDDVPSFSSELGDIPPEQKARYAVTTPNGQTITELADAYDIDPDIIREQAVKRVRTNQLLLKIAGEDDGNPRLYRNPFNSLFRKTWALYAETKSAEEVDAMITAWESDIDDYKDNTGYDSPDELVSDFKKVDLSHIETHDTGEIYWDVVVPWSTTLQQCTVGKFVRDNYEFLEQWTKHTDIEANSVHGEIPEDTNTEDLADLTQLLGLETYPRES